MRPRYRWHLRSRSLELGERTLVMGVVNVTPDSFYDGGSFLSPERAVEHALQLIDEGADILDVGGESTRPGSRVAGEEPSAQHKPVSQDEELERILPVIEGILRSNPQALISVDTYKAAVARAAVAAGAEVVNDVSAFQWDSQMADTCAELECGVVMMHTRGTPGQWRSLTREANVVQLVEHDLANRVQVAFEHGVQRPAHRTRSRLRLWQEFRRELSPARSTRPITAPRFSCAGGYLTQIFHWSNSRKSYRPGSRARRSALWITCGDGY